jgi:hypothetical protein
VTVHGQRIRSGAAARDHLPKSASTATQENPNDLRHCPQASDLGDVGGVLLSDDDTSGMRPYVQMICLAMKNEHR